MHHHRTGQGMFFCFFQCSSRYSSTSKDKLNAEKSGTLTRGTDVIWREAGLDKFLFE
jgi:hypothetical protein